MVRRRVGESRTEVSTSRRHDASPETAFQIVYDQRYLFAALRACDTEAHITPDVVFTGRRHCKAIRAQRVAGGYQSVDLRHEIRCFCKQVLLRSQRHLNARVRCRPTRAGKQHRVVLY